MTRLKINVNQADKTLSCEGVIAVGEDIELVVDLGGSLSDYDQLRVRFRFANEDVAVFPLDYDIDEWTEVSTLDSAVYKGIMTLNTEQLLYCFSELPERATMTFDVVVDQLPDDDGTDDVPTLFGRGRVKIRNWSPNMNITDVQEGVRPVSLLEIADRKIDKVTGATPGHLPVFNADGGLESSGVSLQSLQGKVARSDFANVQGISVNTIKNVAGKVNEILAILKGTAGAVVLALFALAAQGVPFEEVLPTTAVDTNTVGIAHERIEGAITAAAGIGGTVSNIVTKAFVEDLGIESGTDGGAVSNIVEGIVADATNALPRGVAIDLRGDGSTIVTNAALSGTAYTEWDNYGELPDGQLTYGLRLLFDEIAQHEAFSGRYPAKTSLGTAAFRDASEFATAADEALVYQLLMGSNVVAEVTNYNSRVRSPQLRLLQLDPDTKEYCTVWAETNGLTRTLNEGKAYTDEAVAALSLSKADRAWSHHTSGLGADAPAGVTWISTPETVVAGGYEYAKQITTHGEVWVLTSNGFGLGADTNAFFAVRSGDGETLFSIEKTDSILVGVDADGISVSGGVVTIPLGVVSQDPPVCYAANSLVNATWTDLTQTPLPAWVASATCTGTPGAWVWTVETTAPSAFFQFRVLQPGATVIRNNAQTDLSAGILINGTRYYPHASGDTLTWTTTP